MTLAAWLASDGVALIAGLGAGWRWASRRRAAEAERAARAKRDSEGRWRTAFAALNAFLLTLGYETEVCGDEYVVEAPGARIVLRVPVSRLDPAALQADLGDLPPAREWAARRRPPKRGES